ncbi:hypothetical protein ACFV1L_18565 [Kitasatospora sp. NPDC059646]|uniref:hypothetical protein n=1 Tax=Kitasatospora sp. NPDC059646 TaxID=3346893 RepID=UPI0036770DAC
MCIRIRHVDLAVQPVLYDPPSVSILVRRDANPRTAVAEIGALLSDLDAPAADEGALFCFCGDTIPLPPEYRAVPHAGRRDDHRQVILRGA